MRTIAFVTQKGGSGKSTLAACIAVAAQEAGERVFLIDLDAQKSLTKWAQTRDDKTLPIASMSAAKLPSTLAALEANKVSLVVIDTPATDSPLTEAAIKAADLCIIPARPTVFDIWSSEVTRSRIKAQRKEFVFVLNQCPTFADSARVQEGAEALEAMGGLITPPIVSRVDYQEAAREGMGVTEIAPDGKAADETRRLWSSLKRRLKGKAAKARAA